jgi:hypothetical protein
MRYLLSAAPIQSLEPIQLGAEFISPRVKLWLELEGDV